MLCQAPPPDLAQVCAAANDCKLFTAPYPLAEDSDFSSGSIIYHGPVKPCQHKITRTHSREVIGKHCSCTAGFRAGKCLVRHKAFDCIGTQARSNAAQPIAFCLREERSSEVNLHACFIAVRPNPACEKKARPCTLSQPQAALPQKCIGVCCTTSAKSDPKPAAKCPPGSLPCCGQQFLRRGGPKTRRFCPPWKSRR